MKSNLITYFSSAAMLTFKLLLDLDVSIDTNNDDVSSLENNNNIDITIEITGDLSGEITYSFPKDTSLEMVKMMSGIEFNEIDEFVKSALSEIANIISGNAMTGLSEQKVACDILPPKMQEGDNSLPANKQYTIYQTSVKTSVGGIELSLRTAGII